MMLPLDDQGRLISGGGGGAKKGGKVRDRKRFVRDGDAADMAGPRDDDEPEPAPSDDPAPVVSSIAGLSPLGWSVAGAGAGFLGARFVGGANPILTGMAGAVVGYLGGGGGIPGRGQ